MNLKELQNKVTEANLAAHEAYNKYLEQVTRRSGRFNFKINDVWKDNKQIDIVKDLTGSYERMSVNINQIDDFVKMLLELKEVAKLM